MVVELAEGVEGITLGGEWYGTILAREGEPYGQIRGYQFVRDSQGRIVVDENGFPELGSQGVIGNYNPDWLGGWNNELSYKNFDLSFLFDIRQGGDLYSITHMFGTTAGVLEQTTDGRCLLEGQSGANLPPCVEEDGTINGIVFDGVKVTEAGDTVPNDIVTSAQALYRDSYWYAISEAHMFDASYVKLRQLSLTFDVPQNWANRLSLSGIQVGLIGRNLGMWGIDDGLDVDPETAYDASNAQGFEYGSVPSMRSIGFTVTVRP